MHRDDRSQVGRQAEAPRNVHGLEIQYLRLEGRNAILRGRDFDFHLQGAGVATAAPHFFDHYASSDSGETSSLPDNSRSASIAGTSRRPPTKIVRTVPVLIIS